MFAAPFKTQFSYPEILQAYIDCRRRKRSKLVLIAFEIDFERNLDRLLEEVNSGTYIIGPTRAFAISKPKPREIWAAQLRDRIVHHLVYNCIGQFYERRFIEDSFSCIKGRGTLAASNRLEAFCRSATENWHKPAWALQVDIANFFVSISRQKLWEIMRRDLGRVSIVARLVKQIIFNDPTVNAIIKAGTDFSQIPPHKSLWHCKPGHGLPIGNLTSQFMSNVYLDEFDKWVKHTLKAKWYVRYVDDAVFLSHDKEQLHYWLDAVDAWLREHRDLHIHRNKVLICPANQGINFVGRIIKPYRTYPRRMIVATAKEALHKLVEKPLNLNAYQSLQSYLGIMRHSSSFWLRQSICKKAALPLTLSHNSACTKLLSL